MQLAKPSPVTVTWNQPKETVMANDHYSPPAADSLRQHRTARDAMITEHLNLVRMIASRMARRLPSHIDCQDLVNVGILGLIDAVDRFDLSRGTPFKGYAEIRIRGAIVDSLRASDWVPLVVRRKVARIEGARRTLRQRTGVEPGRLEMAGALDLSPEGYDRVVGSAVLLHVVSLDGPMDADSGLALAERIADNAEHPVDRWIGEEARAAMFVAIQQLPVIERDVLRLYYDQGLKYREIGRTLGVCESRVCQLRAQAIAHVRKQVGATAA